MQQLFCTSYVTVYNDKHYYLRAVQSFYSVMNKFRSSFINTLHMSLQGVHCCPMCICNCQLYYKCADQLENTVDNLTQQYISQILYNVYNFL